jgi:hypothetical protein
VRSVPETACRIDRFSSRGLPVFRDVTRKELASDHYDDLQVAYFFFGTPKKRARC